MIELHQVIANCLTKCDKIFSKGYRDFSQRWFKKDDAVISVKTLVRELINISGNYF